MTGNTLSTRFSTCIAWRASVPVRARWYPVFTSRLQDWVRSGARRVVPALRALHLTPNILTMLGLLICAGSAVLIALGFLLPGRTAAADRERIRHPRRRARPCQRPRAALWRVPRLDGGPLRRGDDLDRAPLLLHLSRSPHARADARRVRADRLAARVLRARARAVARLQRRRRSAGPARSAS